MDQHVASAAPNRAIEAGSGLAAPTALSAGATLGAGTLIAFATAPGQVAPFDGPAEPVFAQMETEPQVQTQARADVRAAEASGAR